jgi:hypothetical protein
LGEQSFGRWRVTDAIGEPVPRKAVVEIRADDEALVMAGDDASVLGTWPVGRIRFERYGAHNGYLDLAGQSAWITSVDKRSGDDLAAFLGDRWVPQPPARPGAPAEDGPTFTHTYPAATPAEAGRAFTEDAERQLARGYRPASQFWADPDRSTATAFRAGGVIVILASLLFLAIPIITILMLALAGLLFLMGSLAVGDGSLTVTYAQTGEHAEAQGPAGGESAGPPDPVVADARVRLHRLAALRDEGLITPDEYEARRSAILAAL